MYVLTVLTEWRVHGIFLFCFSTVKILQIISELKWKFTALEKQLRSLPLVGKYLKRCPFQMALVVKSPPANRRQEMWVRSLGWEDPLEKGMVTHSRILVWRTWQRSLVGYSRITRVGHNLSDLACTNYWKKKFLSRRKLKNWEARKNGDLKIGKCG